MKEREGRKPVLLRCRRGITSIDDRCDTIMNPALESTSFLVEEASREASFCRLQAFVGTRWHKGRSLPKKTRPVLPRWVGVDMRQSLCYVFLAPRHTSYHCATAEVIKKQPCTHTHSHKLDLNTQVYNFDGRRGDGLQNTSRACVL